MDKSELIAKKLNNPDVNYFTDCNGLIATIESVNASCIHEGYYYRYFNIMPDCILVSCNEGEPIHTVSLNELTLIEGLQDAILYFIENVKL